MLLLVRHAAPAIDPSRPASEWSLSAAGRAAAALLAAAVPVDAVVSSLEPKALETAEAFGLPVELDNRLREHVRGSGVPHFDDPRALERAVAAGFARPHEAVFGDESFDAAQERFAAAVDDARARHAGRLAVVAHGTVIALYAARALGADPLALWRSLGLPDAVELP